MKSRNGSSSLTGPPRDGRAAAASGGGAWACVAPFGGPSGGVLGTGIGRLASLLAERRGLAASRAAVRALRLTGPFTGTRLTNTQPTYGTGLPPISRPSSNSHGYSP